MLFSKKSKNTQDADPSVLLLLEIPRTNDKKELAAEQMFAALHGILRPKREILRDGTLQEHIGFEIAAIGQRIRFYIWTPKHLQTFVEGQIYAQYPAAQILPVEEDYAARALPQPVIMTSELTLTDHETIPIKSFPSFEVDPLAAITATLAKLEGPDEEMWIQVLARPIDDDWHKQGSKMIAKIKKGKGSGFGGSGFAYMGQVLGALAKPPEAVEKKKDPELSERDKTRIKSIEEKGTKLGYRVKVRIVYAGQDERTARLRMQGMVGTFKQFNTTNLNGFQSKIASYDRTKVAEYRARHFLDNGFILNIEELASVYHLPHTSVETPNIVWATVKTAEPPPNLPAHGKQSDDDVSLFGVTNFRGTNTVFGSLRSDRGRHIYVVGQTGTGKSGLLELLMISDVFQNHGFAAVDPHGDLAGNIIRFIPESRVDDVIYFNPADTDFPIGFNPLEVPDPSLKNHISSELVGVLKRMFDSWGPRLEYILRYTILALLDYPNSTMLDITRMLTEKQFRNKVISCIDDPVVKTFWVTEFASWNEKYATEAVAPVLNKIGAFTANPLVRNIIGQPKGSFNIRKVMDEGKILLVNLSRGLIGEDNAGILGAMIVTKIQLAAMSRADIKRIEDRRPFYLYVDEFQNFATDSFAVILSEARKYALNLAVANQYISQMTESVRGAVFGNVGTIVSFRVSPDDAPFLQKYFEPQFEASDLIRLHNRQFVANMTIGGEKAPAFSGKTLVIPKVEKDYVDTIIALSRQKYTRTREVVEAEIRSANEANEQAMQQSKPQQNRQPNHNQAQHTSQPQRPRIIQQKPPVQSSNSPEVHKNSPQPEIEKKTVSPSRDIVFAAGKVAVEKAETIATTNEKTQKEPPKPQETQANNSTPTHSDTTDAPQRKKRTRSRRKNRSQANRTNIEHSGAVQIEQKQPKSNGMFENDDVISLR